ncbi:thioredoxin domain-containing protein 16-like [Lytechinus pictus]|uniref:thioredoxin domain-containing protein 16-like n=1 Tax=Lytechinus pictus TaxID=7653 RepID=UPI0030B9FCE4
MAGSSAFLFFSFLSIFAISTSSEFYNTVTSQAFNDVKKSKEIVAISFIRTTPPYSESFQSHFSEAGDYLEDYGVFFGTVNCLSDPVPDYCLRSDASENLYIFRHGSFLITLAYDTLFSVDSIVSNILHLVLLIDVPIIGEPSNLLEKQDKWKGKRDIIMGYVPAVGTAADRAFMEVAFAYRHKYDFILTTNRYLLEEEQENKPNLDQLPDPVVGISQCSKAQSHQDCMWVKYHGPVTLESLSILMLNLVLPDLDDVPEGGQSNMYKEHGVPSLYAITDPTNHERALSLILDVKDEYQGNLGFTVVNRADVTDSNLLADLEGECIPACFVLQSHDKVINGGGVNDASGLKAFIKANIQHVFSYLYPNQDESDDEKDIETHYTEDYIPVQERQDDLVQEATSHSRLAFERKKYITPALTDKTFPKFTGQSHLTSVLFTMEWNPRSLAFLDSFDSAAESIMSFSSTESQEPPLGRVECSNWPDVCDKNNVTVYPTVKMYREQSDIATYGGILDKSNVLKSYLLYKLSNPMDLKDLDEVGKATKGIFPAPWVKDHMTSLTLAVIPDGFKQEKAVFQQVAEELRGEYLFGLCTSHCAQEVQSSFPDQANPSITVMKWNDPEEPQQKFIEGSTFQDLVAFVKQASLPLLPELTASSMPIYLARHKPFVILFHAGDEISEVAAQSMKQIANTKYGHQYTLCQMDITDEESIGSQTLTTYGFLPSPEQATIAILDHALGEVCRCPHGNAPSETALTAWLEVSLESPKQCSEARALMNREWKPLVPPYDFLKFMEDEQHIAGGRRGLGSYQDDTNEGTDEKEEEKPARDAEDSMKVNVAMNENKHSHSHVEL